MEQTGKSQLIGADVDTVEVPETTIPVGFSVSEIENIDPLASSDEYGIDLNLKVHNKDTSNIACIKYFYNKSIRSWYVIEL